MIAKFKNFVKKNQKDIVLIIGVILVSLLSFALGYLTAKYQEKIPLQLEELNYYLSNWRL